MRIIVNSLHEYDLKSYKYHDSSVLASRPWLARNFVDRAYLAQVAGESIGFTLCFTSEWVQSQLSEKSSSMVLSFNYRWMVQPTCRVC